MNDTQNPLRVADFERYRQENPDLEEVLVRFAREVQAAGFKHYGMKGLFERARWHYHMEMGSDGFKLNNSFTAPYARLLMEKYPDLAGFFETRERTATPTD